MPKINLNTKSHGIVSLDGADILTNDVQFPFSYNPHNVKLYIIGNEFGAIVALWASNEQDALDEMVDNNYEQFLISPVDFDAMREDEKEDCSFLGNASEPCNLDYAWIDEVVIDPADMDGLRLMLSLALAWSRCAATLEHAEYY